MDEIHAIHLIEHIWRGDVDGVLQEWHRVLKPGGLLVLECPCLDKVARWLVSPKDMPHSLWLRHTLLALYGEFWHEGKQREAMAHHWCYCAAELSAVVEGAGFTDVTVAEPIYHFVSRDMRVTARKSRDGAIDVFGSEELDRQLAASLGSDLAHPGLDRHVRERDESAAAHYAHGGSHHD